MTIDESTKRILDKIENDEELRKLGVLIDTHPEYKDEILTGWVNKAMEDAKLIPPAPSHIGCKQDPRELCRQVDELYQEVFGDLEELFRTVPKLNRFEKDLL